MLCEIVCQQRPLDRLGRPTTASAHPSSVCHSVLQILHRSEEVVGALRAEAACRLGLPTTASARVCAQTSTSSVSAV